jgi:hypothetical protein
MAELWSAVASVANDQLHGLLASLGLDELSELPPRGAASSEQRWLQTLEADAESARRELLSLSQAHAQERAARQPPRASTGDGRAAQDSPALERLRRELCPAQLSEEAFWAAYWGVVDEGRPCSDSPGADEAEELAPLTGGRPADAGGLSRRLRGLSSEVAGLLCAGALSTMAAAERLIDELDESVARSLGDDSDDATAETLPARPSGCGAPCCAGDPAAPEPAALRPAAFPAAAAAATSATTQATTTATRAEKQASPADADTRSVSSAEAGGGWTTVRAPDERQADSSSDEYELV